MTVALAAGGAGCGGSTEPLEAEGPSVAEREATTAALLDELSIEGALLDDTPDLRLLSATLSSSTRISEAPRAPVPRPVDKVLHAWGASVPASCATVSGPTTDADGDGIPPTASVHFDCTAPSYGVSGTAFVLDDNDADAASGYSLGLSSFVLRTSAPAAAVTRTVDGSFLLYVRDDPSPGAVDIKIDARVAAVRGTADNASETSFKSAGVTTYLPDADLRPTVRSHRGSVTSSVTTIVTYRGVAHTWTRRATPSLRWNLGCKTASSGVTGFDGGGAIYVDERGNTLRIDFTSCTNWVTSLVAGPG